MTIHTRKIEKECGIQSENKDIHWIQLRDKKKSAATWLKMQNFLHQDEMMKGLHELIIKIGWRCNFRYILESVWYAELWNWTPAEEPGTGSLLTEHTVLNSYEKISLFTWRFSFERHDTQICILVLNVTDKCVLSLWPRERGVPARVKLSS